jgi:hypothetical protein
MKKQIFYLASAALAVGLAACTNDELDENYASDGVGFTASIQQANIDEEAETRLAISGTSLKWEVNDNIGLYYNNDENYEYKIADEDHRLISKFTPADKSKTLEQASYAYYPYDESASATLAGNINVTLDGYYNSNGEGSTSVDKGAILYEEKVVKMPMAGTVTGSSIKFKNTTALLQVTVVNMPADVNAATLSSTASGKKLTGPAVMNIKNGTLELGSTESNHNKITYVSSKDDKTAFTTGKTYTFYFIIPAADYTTADNADNGLKFALEKTTGTSVDGNKLSFSADLKAEANHLYAKTVYYDETLEDFENSTLTKINNQLAKGGNAEGNLGGSTDAKGTLYIPTFDEAKEEVTITLKNVADGALTIAADGNGYTPKKVIVKVGNYTADNETTPKQITLTINLPKSSVEIAPLDNEKLTINTLTFTTAPNVLRVDNGVTVTALNRKTSGHVYVEGGASVSGVTDAAYYIFKDNATTSSVAPTTDFQVKIVGKEIYQLLYPSVGERPKLSETTTLLTPVEINVDDVELDLQGFTLNAASGKSAIIVNKGGKLTIKNTVASGAKDEGIVAGSTASSTIDIEEGEVVLEGGKITSVASVYAVKVAKGTFTMNGGVIKGTAETADAITVTDGGTVTLNSADKIGGTGEDKNYTIDGDILITNTTTAGTVTLKQGTVNGDVTVSGSSATVSSSFIQNGGKVNDIKVGANGTVEVNGGEAASIADTATNAGKGITVTGGTIGAEADNAIDTTTGGTPVTINVAAGGKATIGNEDAEAAIALKDGQLTVTGEGEPTLLGATVINIDDAAKSAKVTLAAANAKYEATDKGYVLKNSKFDSVTELIAAEAAAAADDDTLEISAAAKLSITAGIFDGDVLTDASNQFIKGGQFKNCVDLYNKGVERNWFVLGYGLGKPGTDDYMTVGVK